jgi:hypothetical protein
MLQEPSMLEANDDITSKEVRDADLACGNTFPEGGFQAWITIFGV